MGGLSRQVKIWEELAATSNVDCLPHLDRWSDKRELSLIRDASKCRPHFEGGGYG